jgi:hypothetical protein
LTGRVTSADQPVLALEKPVRIDLDTIGAICVANAWYDIKVGSIRIGTMDFGRGPDSKTVEAGGLAFSCETTTGGTLYGPVSALQLLQSR